MVSEKVAIVIPALNEEAAIHHLLAELPQDFAQWVIVVDNGSMDATATVAQRSGALVASEPIRGNGRACLKGFNTACSLGAEIVIFMDGDGSDDPNDLPIMLRPISEGRADFVVGSRVSVLAERGAVPPLVRCSLLKSIELREMTYGWPVEMLVKAARAHYRIVEVPIHYRHRSHGRSKVAGTITGSIKAAYYMLSITVRYTGARRTHA